MDRKEHPPPLSAIGHKVEFINGIIDNLVRIVEALDSKVDAIDVKVTNVKFASEVHLPCVPEVCTSIVKCIGKLEYEMREALGTPNRPSSLSKTS